MKTYVTTYNNKTYYYYYDTSIKLWVIYEVHPVTGFQIGDADYHGRKDFLLTCYPFLDFTYCDEEYFEESKPIVDDSPIIIKQITY